MNINMKVQAELSMQAQKTEAVTVHLYADDFAEAHHTCWTATSNLS